ncbi:MAG TPA: phosphoribosyltransferase, partial [Phycisphaerae bacterium]|nr:phosphoribosyltransferase [Phycisphaerae bacterium]
MDTEDRIPVFDLQAMRDRAPVFSGRDAAGEVLAGMLQDYRESGALVLAIPAGGVAVGAPIAKRLHLDLDVAVVNKITPPWNAEWGFGAVAF